MTYPAREESDVDEPSRRYGAYMAIAFVAQFVCGLLGIGVEEGTTVRFLHPLLIAAALAVRSGRRWGRSVLVGFAVVFLALGVLIVFAAGPGAVVLAIPIVAVLFLHLTASAFTLATEPPALGLPERWRPWATSKWLHVLLLVLGLLGALVGAETTPSERG